jgi:hypothetical protein
MSLTLDGTNGITSSGGTNVLQADAVITSNLVDGAVTDAKIAAMATSKLTGRVPAANAPLGSVIQVVSAQITAKTTVSVATAGTFYDIAGFSATITPSSATSKILFLAMVNHSFQSIGGNRQYLRIMRNSTAIGIGDASGSQYRTTTGFYIGDSFGIVTQPLNWLDSPNTTSATTYKLQVTTNANSQTACFNRTVADDQDDRSVTASQILVLEIAA